jgi:HSP20 family protein
MLFDPFEELRKLQERMNRLFEEFERFRFPEMREIRMDAPMDVIDEEDQIRVVADLPGFNKEDIKVYIEDGDLVIRAERREEKEEKHKDYLRQERRYGKVYRRISLPSDLNLDKIKARYTNGVLEITIPKVEKEVKKIEIE